MKIAILGGGCGGLAAAWALSATPQLRERFEVTVYERGWQLGGKGASGRAPRQTRSVGVSQRIEEHGLHIWFGFYEHAFRMLRGAYSESGLASGEDWWRVPFERCDSVCLYEQRQDGCWSRHPIGLPRRGGADRGPPTDPRRAPLGKVLARTTRLLATGLRGELRLSETRRGGSVARPHASGLAGAAATLDQLARELDHVESTRSLDADGVTGQLTARGLRLGGRPLRSVRAASLGMLVVQLSDQARALRSELSTHQTSDRMRLWSGIVELVAASLGGIVRDDVLWRGFDTLDQEDLREWLRRHGASEQTVDRSPVLRGLYDLTFAYRCGDKERPSLAAGKGLQSLLMMINYEGSFMWRMRAGMGDVVFAPLYLALKQRGVQFQFFSRVTALRLVPGRPVIDAVELVREETVASGPQRYEPIKRIGEWWCWPAAPYEDQLDDRMARPETLRRNVDFDEVVLAIPVGALPGICGELAEANPRFKQMLDGAETVRTRAFQVWLTKPVEELRRWSAGRGLDPPTTAYAEPFDTYCDMSHLLEAEGRGADGGPRGVAYFCGVLPDAIAASEADASVRASAMRYLEREAGAIWPAAYEQERFDWSVVFDPLERMGRARLEAQYFRANVADTDRYVTTPAGSVEARLDPAGSGFENLVLAGDWTHNGIDGGCVEAAVISGERAAEGIIARRSRGSGPPIHRNAYVEYGALATAPGPLLCERARLYCFFVQTDRARVQQLCDRVFKQPTGGALRFRVPRMAPVILTVGTIAGLRSLHPQHSGRGSASEPEAAIWVPTVAQRFEGGRYVDDHLAVFMPYIWVDDPIAFASGREVYGFAKTQGWMRPLPDPRSRIGSGDVDVPQPPEELSLDVYGAPAYGSGAVLTRQRLITVRRRPRVRGGEPRQPDEAGRDLGSLVGHFIAELEPSSVDGSAVAIERPRRSMLRPRPQVLSLAELMREQATRLVFLKQIRDAQSGEWAELQQVVEARSTVTPGSLRWRRLRGSYELSVASLESHPLEDELGLVPDQSIKHAFAAEFGFRMEPGVVRWP